MLMLCKQVEEMDYPNYVYVFLTYCSMYVQKKPYIKIMHKGVREEKEG